MESSNTTPQLSCEQVRQLLDDKSAGASPDALRQHLKTCADCRAELRLRAVMSQLMEEPPADLTDSVMSRIRAEQKKTASRLRFIRRAGAVAAAVVLIPAVVILAPILLRTGNSVTSDDAAPRIGKTTSPLPARSGISVTRTPRTHAWRPSSVLPPSRTLPPSDGEPVAADSTRG